MVFFWRMGPGSGGPVFFRWGRHSCLAHRSVSLFSLLLPQRHKAEARVLALRRAWAVVGILELEGHALVGRPTGRGEAVVLFLRQVRVGGAEGVLLHVDPQPAVAGVIGQ